MRKIKKLTGIIATAAFISMPALANDVGVGLAIGSDGITLQGKLAVSPRISVTAGYNYLKLSNTKEYGRVEYDGKLDYSNISAFVNYHPFGNGFKLEGGGYYGDKTLTLLGTPAGAVQIGDVTYSASEVGTLSGGGYTERFRALCRYWV
ncbi:MAG: hypothetical protein COA69_02950 [Robiginitomaculum sp.]|nr:MAG: hypothetical protein COA69_02950 [Robiginitomaculum sp.]